MRLGDSGMAFLPDGGPLPGGSYPVYATVDLDDEGAVSGEVHFLSEPKYPRPISIGTEFSLHMPQSDSIVGEDIVLRVKFVDGSGAITGYRHGSLAQFRPNASRIAENVQKVEITSLDPRNVFVIHGRDKRLRDGMFAFLRSLDLNPLEWAQAVELTGKGAPYVGEVLEAAFANAQAVVVLFTPDDLAELRPDLRAHEEPEHELKPTPQARPNVLFEAGMAMAANEDRTILVEIGKLRPFSDIGGRHTIRMDNSTQKRNELAARLAKAGCPVKLNGTDWHTFGDLRQPVFQIPNGLPDRVQQANAQAAMSVQIEGHLLQDLISELEDNLEQARAPRIGDAYSRPSNSVWRAHRNKLNIPQDTHNQIANAYRGIDQWLDVVSTGLSPNMGSLALELKFNDLKHQLPGLIRELKKVEVLSSLPTLSVDAQQLLLKATEDGGTGSIMYVEVNEGLILQIDRQPFAETGNRRSEAKWRQAIDELSQLKLIKRPAPDADIYDVTHAGYEYADRLRSANARTANSKKGAIARAPNSAI